MKIFDYISYVIDCLNAVTKGLKAMSDNLPTNNPFVDSTDQNSDGIKK